MGGYLHLTGKILLAELGLAAGAKMLGILGGNSSSPLRLDSRTIDALEIAAMINTRGSFDRALDDAGVTDSTTRNSLWKHYRSR